MPRTARIVLPDQPHHVIHRGHNRSTLFAAAADYRSYLASLAEWKRRLGCRVFGYCLMTNHVHLIVDPGSSPDNLGRLMKRIAGRFTRYVNRLEGRTGTAWNGRFKSSPIDTDEYLLACSRYIDLNPVRAGLVASPSDYAWSSYAHKTGTVTLDWLDDDPCYLALGDDRAQRVTAYRRWVGSAIPRGEWARIRTAAQRGQLCGGRRFRDEVAARLGVRVESRGPGRPAGRRRIVGDEK